MELGTMAKKLPVIIDKRNDNTLLNALRQLLPNLKNMDVATGIFEVGSLLSLDGLRTLEKHIRSSMYGFQFGILLIVFI
jgi:hypothetical protein